MRVHRHQYYFQSEVVDLNKLREAAKMHVVGDYRNPPAETSTIHYHKKEDTCVGKQHEEFRREDQKGTK